MTRAEQGSRKMNNQIVNEAQKILEGTGDGERLAQLVINAHDRCGQLWKNPRTDEVLQCRYHREHTGRCKVGRR